MTGIEEVRARAADLEHQRDTAPDEETARAAAEELHELLDAVENVTELGGQR